MNTCRFYMCLSVALSCLFAASAQGADYYVSPSGTDNPDCLAASPCREIRQAVDLVVGGDTIHVANGDYLGFDVRSKIGAKDAPILIRGEGPDVEVLPTSDRPDNRDNIFITNSDWIVIDSLKTFNAPRAGLRVDQSHNVHIQNSTFGPNQTWGIFTNHSNDLVIENNEAFGSMDEHGIYISNSGDRPTVRNNIVRDNSASGIQLNASLLDGAGRGVRGDGIITGAIVEKNEVYSNGVTGGAAINLDGVQEAIIVNNLLYDNHGSGIAAFKIDGAEGPKNVRIFHNTIDMAPDGRWVVRITDSKGPVQVKNNILLNHDKNRGGISLAQESSHPSVNPDIQLLMSDYNVFGGASFAATPNDTVNKYSLKQWQQMFNKDLHSLVAAPSSLFVDLASQDYGLLPASAAVDRGIVLPGVQTDINGLKRPLGPSSDIGAYEVMPASISP